MSLATSDQLHEIYRQLDRLQREGAPLLADELLRLAEVVASGDYGLEADEMRADSLVEQAATAGHPLAMVEMAAREAAGRDALNTRAAQWLEAAAALGEVQAMFNLAVAKITGQGEPGLDPEGGWRLIERAADRGYAPALFQLAADLLRGKNHPQSTVRAKFYELQALDAGSEQARRTINSFFGQDDLGEDDAIDTRRVIDNAAADGCAQAIFEKANRMFLEQLRDADKSTDTPSSEPSAEVTALLTEAAEGGSSDAICNLASTLIARGDTAGAMPLLEKGVAIGHFAAKGMLGRIFAADEATRAQGVKLLTDALNYGYAPAMQSLTQLIADGAVDDPTGGVRRRLYEHLFWKSFASGTNDA